MATFYKALATVTYTLKYFSTDTLDNNRLANAYSDYLGFYDDYTDYIEDINSRVEATSAFANKLAGLE